MSITNYFDSLVNLKRSNENYPQELHGIQNPSVLALNPDLYRNQKTLIILPSDEEIEKLEHSFSTFTDLKLCSWKADSHNPYNNVFTSYNAVAQRTGFLAKAAEASSGVFLVHARNLVNYCSPKDFFEQASIKIKQGDTVSSNFLTELKELGYRQVDTVEDPLSFSSRGEIVDIYSPNHDQAIRIEFFDTEIESIRLFDPEMQKSSEIINETIISPALEVLHARLDIEEVINRWKKSCEEANIDWASNQSYISKLNRRQNFEGIHYLFPYAHKDSVELLDYFNESLIFYFDAHECLRQWDLHFQNLKTAFANFDEENIRPPFKDLYHEPSGFHKNTNKTFYLNPVQVLDDDFIKSKGGAEYKINLSLSRKENLAPSKDNDVNPVIEKIKSYKYSDHAVFCFFSNPTQMERARYLLKNAELNFKEVRTEDINIALVEEQRQDNQLVHLCMDSISEGFQIPSEHLVFLNSNDFFGRKRRKSQRKAREDFNQQAGQFKFADLKEGDHLVHIQHGVGIYKGMAMMDVQGIKSEFIQLEYRGNDKLYVPIYKIGLLQKYSGTHGLDKLGGKSWENSKVKVKNSLKDIADELIRLYAKRSQLTRPAYSPPNEMFHKFEDEFPYVETDDQLKAMTDILSDLGSDKPMDRLICGDVGFGKTEIAMRAAFKVLEENKQVALLVPTTVLAFQHYENFKKRFKNWPFEIRSMGRFTPKSEMAETLENLKLGHVNMIIGTHRILSKDVDFKNLGLLIVDEEHRFGVAHKEKLKQLKASVDNLSLSATPIPRTLNMSLVGIRDLSTINTAPQDRLPTRTYINRFNKGTIKTAIEAELQRNGQVYFIHNRVQSIYSRAAEIREILPDIKLEVAHGQMKDGELEKVMLRFYQGKFDVLLCTTIVENGVDNPRANTMIIDNAHHFGLSQLYQLRGRVGRSKERAYCYLVVPQNTKLDPDAKERLRIIQENTALGSGFKIAHHDLELRGAGSFLGAEQSGNVNTVGYDLYLELLEQSIREAKGEEKVEEIEPEINLRIPALIPDAYIPDIRVRLSFYKLLSEIDGEDDIESIESSMIDQFGKIPEQVLNLMGVMLIRKYCKDLGIKDISAGSVNISLSFSSQTKIAVNKLVELAIKQPKTYRLTPDSRLIVRMPELSWPQVLNLVKFLKKDFLV
ncbi:MAG: transcription-repair coupling factor [Bdellovibrionaceae bacterium]|nr:transcription-repair coupling factor [Pseudobdellovibrionaceae bacterium]|tara:strand:+ start:12574 stop:16044 length:3471 start_codon:yes stop_codon:yes gene_type:complete